MLPRETDREFNVRDYPHLLDLLGPEEFERQVCPLEVARERYKGWMEGYRLLEACVCSILASGG